jgi:hypothetical protein
LHGEFPFVEYVGADSVLQGIEAHSDFQLTGGLAAELGFDYVVRLRRHLVGVDRRRPAGVLLPDRAFSRGDVVR